MQNIFKLLILLLFLASNPAHAKLKVLTSFALLADISANVALDKAEVSTLVGKGADVHVYQPSPAAVKQLQQADIFIVNGLGLEGWQRRLLQASGFKGQVVVASNGINAKQQSFAYNLNRRDYDPHAWHDLANAKIYVENISRAFCSQDKTNCPAYQANAAAYKLKLDKLDAWFREKLTTIPQERRFIVSNHLALAYLGRAYDIGIIAVQGFSTEAAPSARDIAQVIKQIRGKKISTIFYENLADQRMSRQIARETNTKIGAPLYVDNLDNKAPADTYLGMMRANFANIIKALAD